MVLKALELQGFKSFADKTVLSFDQGMTAIVGPNGSGKSNISDAIRWVLGEQSAKNLRGSKMENVIFDGTASRKGVGFAEVSLIIDNTNRTLEMDSDEVKVTRRYYRSGDSDYQLNNATVRLKDIQMLFMDTGLGRDGYSIIGQGRVDDIVASKSEERREIFEEAAGIAKYRYRKNEAERRLKNAEENLLRLRDILTELEERIGPLEQQSKKAKKFLEYAEEKKGLEIGLWLHTIDRSREVLRELNEKLELARTQYDQAGADIDALEQQTEQLRLQAEQLHAQMDEVRRGAQTLEEQAAQQEALAAVRRNDRKHNEENITRMEGEIARSHTGGQQLQEEEDARCRTIAENERQMAEAQQRQRTLSEQIEALAHDSDVFSGQLDVHTHRASALAMQLSDARVKKVTGESALAEIAARLSQLTAAQQLRAGQRQQAQEDLDENEQSLQACQNRVSELHNAASGYELRVQSRRKKLTTAREQADQCKLDAQEKTRHAEMLQNMERSMEGFQESVKAVMKQAQRGELRGIHGSVAQLLDADKTCALAVETALGAATQNLICDTEEDAKRGIAYLKNHRVGRATFLPLSTVQGRELNEKGLEQEEGFVGLAHTLCSCKPAYKEVARSLLGRTAVVQSLDDAVRIARKYGYRFRLVTLDGQVVNAGGSLTGGAHVKSAGLLSRRADIEALTAQAAQLTEKAEQARTALHRAEQEAASAEAEWQGTLAELSTAQEDSIRMQAEHRRLSELLTAAQTASAENETEIEALQVRAEECRTSMAQADREIADIGGKQTLVNEEIERMTGGRQELTQQREALATQVGECKLYIVGCEKEIEAQRQAIAQLQSRRADAEGYRQSLADQIAAVQQENVRIDADIEALAAQATALRTEAGSVGDKIAALTQTRLEGEALQTTLRQRARAAADQRELLGRDMARMEEKRDHARGEAEELTNRLLEEYNLTRAEAQEQAGEIEDVPAAGRRLNELKNKIRALGSVNVDAIEEFKEVGERYAFLSEQVKDVEQSRSELLTLIDDLMGQMKEMFITRFEQINEQFGKVFAELFDGGKAGLELTDPQDVLNSGINMSAQPPGKKIHHLDSLSGGEKALVAISLLFAILRVTPSPFCVLDEIEAALDDINVDRYASYLQRMSDKTQFIVITHRRGTMEAADVLYGVTMQEKGVSKLLELRVSEVQQKLGMESIH